VFRRLRHRTPLGVSCLDIAGSDEICLRAPMFLSDRLVSERVVKLCWMLPSCNTISRSMVKSASREYHGSRYMWTSNGGLSLCDKEELAS
jgi:hypothetical protein